MTSRLPLISITQMFLLTLIVVCLSLSVNAQSQKNRLIILADMGNEPDEEQQMMHLMMSANEVDLEGLIAVTGLYLRPEVNNPYKQSPHPDLFLVDL